jgi:hypothetical protein
MTLTTRVYRYFLLFCLFLTGFTSRHLYVDSMPTRVEFLPTLKFTGKTVHNFKFAHNTGKTLQIRELINHYADYVGKVT